MQISTRASAACAALAIATCFVAACGGGASTGAADGATNGAAPAPVAGGAPPASPPSAADPAEPTRRESLAVVASHSFEYTPAVLAHDAASDPDVARPYTIANRPAWAEFDADTGTLSGTPGAADVGQYANVRIARGASVVTLDLDVVASAAGVARLSWEPPLVRRDGSPFDDVAGYRVYYGRSATQLTQALEIDDPNVREAEIADLPRGTWYFVATAVDSLGAESELSAPASKTIG